MNTIKLEENEVLIKVIKKHWLPVFFEFFAILILAIVPIVFFFIFKASLFVSLTVHNIYVLLFLYLSFLIFVWIIAFISWIDFDLDVWILTNKRLINVEQITLFSRKISSIRLDRIQNIKVEVLGLVSTIFKIGNLYVQTAALQKDLVIHTVGEPEVIKEIINSAYHNEEEEAKSVRIK